MQGGEAGSQGQRQAVLPKRSLRRAPPVQQLNIYMPALWEHYWIEGVGNTHFVILMNKTQLSSETRRNAQQSAVSGSHARFGTAVAIRSRSLPAAHLNKVCPHTFHELCQFLVIFLAAVCHNLAL